MVMSDPRVIVATALLIAGVIDDLRSRKVHNWLIVVGAVLATLVTIVTHGWSGVLMGIAGFCTATVLMLPLVILKIVGAGDMKLVMVVGIVSDWHPITETILLAIFVGAILGIFRTCLQGEGKLLIQNSINIFLRREKSRTLQLHTIPYTVALFLGWLSHLSLTSIGRSLI